MILLLSVRSSYSQITLTSTTGYIEKPAGVVTEIVKKSGVTEAGQICALQSHERLTTQSYVDGFGRPLQSIVIDGSPNGKNIIQFYKYDEFGRTTKSFLPFEYAQPTGSGENPTRPYQDRSTAETNQASFYTTNTTTNKIAYDTKPWVQSEVEQSPMQRLLKQGNAGNNFQTDQHYQMVLYRTNESGDNSINGGVRKWDAAGTSSGTYSVNDLTVVEAVDDGSASDPGRTIVFTDKMGRTILKRQKNGSDYFDTYYVYNLSGNVAYVVPPKAVARLNAISSWDVSNVSNLIFSYKYDTKGRVTEKKVPGAQVIYMVYDPLDRVVLVQDGKMRAANKWYYTKYDSRFRSITEGIYTDATRTTLSSMQSYVDGLSCYSSSTDYYEERTTGTSSYYTNDCFPTSGTEERAYYYYDDYDFDNSGSADYSYTSQSLTGEGTATDKTLGILTGVKKKILGTSNWLVSYTFYDKKYNPIQTKSNNQLKVSTVSDIKTNVIDFAGRLTISKEYRSTASSGGTTITVQNTFSYDKMDRLQEIKQSNDGQTEVLVGKYEYNPLGQLVDKKLHSTNSGSSFLQSVDLRYNIRGQLTSINNSTLSSDGGTTNDESNDVWGMNLFYEQEDEGISNTPQWTGMLSAVKWKASPPSGGNTDERSYIFSYDKLYRLTTATYKAKTGSTWTKDVYGFDENVTYDWGGNIATLLRKSVISGTVTTIDNLTYYYGTNNDNNQLENMTETGSNSYGYRNFTSSSSGYSYDENGNLSADAKKGTTLTYNELNKVVRITQTSTSKYIEFGYDAAGIKLSKTIYDGTTTKTLNYIGAYEFDENNALTSFAMPEGRVRKTGTNEYTFEYFITDHQGNVRVSFEDNSGSAVVRQENSYYPYGMIMAGNYQPSSPNQNLYNAGSRWQDDFSGIVDYFSTFFREYDPVLGRFNSVDPKAVITGSLSVYQYANNNPINFNDPIGDVATYIDINRNKWHGQNPLWGTALDGMVYGIDGKLKEWNKATDWGNFTGWGGGGMNGDGSAVQGIEGWFVRISKEISRLEGLGYSVNNINYRIGRESEMFGASIGFGFTSADGMVHTSTSFVPIEVDYARTLEQWTNHYSGSTWSQIVSEKPAQAFLWNNIKFKGGPNPKWRYIRLDNGKRLDMRHVLVVGMSTAMGYKVGVPLGAIGEVVQYITDPESANKKEDYYSNSIGSQFLSYLREKSFYFKTLWSTAEFGKNHETELSSFFYNFINENILK